MANINAANSNGADVLYWPLVENPDVPVVWSYDCPDGHKVVAAVQLQVDSAGDPTGVDPICPVHQLALDNEADIDVS